MEFRTALIKYQQHKFIDYSSRVLLIGSCFVEHLHNYLQDRKYSSFINPCGISFNPISIAQSISLASGQYNFDDSEIKENNGKFFHYDFHSSFSGLTEEACKKNIEQQISNLKSFPPIDVLVLSLGTAYAYKTKSKGEIVNNCHKIDQTQFEKIFLEPEEIVDSLTNALNEISLANPFLKILITVSPVRHIKDGLIENNRSKSSLILASMRLEKAFDNLIYFPSYELLLDDLRDYRFYGRDKIHPSEEAVDYIMDFFERHFLKDQDQGIRNQVLSIRKRMAHRPFMPDSVEHQDFLKKILLDLKDMKTSTKCNFDQEIEFISGQIR